jgi:hypothetical protein
MSCVLKVSNKFNYQSKPCLQSLHHVTILVCDCNYMKILEKLTLESLLKTEVLLRIRNSCCSYTSKVLGTNTCYILLLYIINWIRHGAAEISFLFYFQIIQLQIQMVNISICRIKKLKLKRKSLGAISRMHGTGTSYH